MMRVMSDAILVALITGGFTFLGVLVVNHSNRKKDAVERAKRDQKFEDRLDRLEQKVDEHNNYGRKFGEASQALVAIQKDVEWLKKGAQK